MKAAVVESFAQTPRYRDFEMPVAATGEVLVRTSASALSQLSRAQAAGRHYSSGTPPFVPGADGVGQLADGQRVYFAFPRAPFGAMAEWVPVAAAQLVPLPDALDDHTAAALANPGMSSWAALTQRASIQPGETVLINGAAGVSGRLAIRIARQLGAGRVIATARNPAVAADLLALGADAFLPLVDGRESIVESFRSELAAGVDIVLDYLWGPSAEALLAAAGTHVAGAAARRLRFVNIGSLGGASIALPAASLRSSGVELLGSGLGSVAITGLIAAIAAFLPWAAAGGLEAEVETLPLSEVARGWAMGSGTRLVFTL